jgi:hypothetical protein
MRQAPMTLLNLLTPIVAGKESALETHLAAMPADGLFARLEIVHFARWVIIGQLRSDFPGAPRRKRPLRMKYLLFSSGFNGSDTDFFEELRLTVGPAVDEVWKHCVNYPGSARRVEFHQYLRHNSLPIRQRFIGYDATVSQVRAALSLRREHIEFAQAAQSLPDDELQQEFLRRFSSRP